MTKKFMYVAVIFCYLQNVQGEELACFENFSVNSPNKALKPDLLLVSKPQRQPTYLNIVGNIVMGIAVLTIPQVLFNTYYDHKKSQGFPENKLEKDNKIKAFKGLKIIIQVSSLYFFQQAWQSFRALQKLKKVDRFQETETKYSFDTTALPKI